VAFCLIDEALGSLVMKISLIDVIKSNTPSLFTTILFRRRNRFLQTFKILNRDY